MKRLPYSKKKKKIKVMEGFLGCTLVRDLPASAGDARGASSVPGSVKISGSRK